MAKRNRKASLRIADEAEQLHRATRDWTKLPCCKRPGKRWRVIPAFLPELKGEACGKA